MRNMQARRLLPQLAVLRFAQADNIIVCDALRAPLQYFPMTTANKITVVRILMIPAFVTMAIYYGESIQRHDPQEWMRFAAMCSTTWEAT